MDKYFFFVIAALTYLVVLFCSVIFKVGKHESPLSAFNKLHIYFSLVYVFASVVLFYLSYTFSLYAVLDFFVGYFFYLGFHYAVFQNFYGLAQRSISASLLILLKANGGMMSVKNCSQAYADGKGFSYIKKSRLEDMVNLDFVYLENGVYKISERGNKISLLIRFILGFWGLNQLGK